MKNGRARSGDVEAQSSGSAVAAASAAKSPEEPAWAEIAQLAYSYWEVRGGQPGSAEDDWYRAENELKTRHAG